jgi:hypothetical protein
MSIVLRSYSGGGSASAAAHKDAQEGFSSNNSQGGMRMLLCYGMSCGMNVHNSLWRI